MRCSSSFLPILALGGLGALSLACGGGSGGAAPVPPGTLTLRLGSDSFSGYAQAVVGVEKVEASTDGKTWVALGNVKATYDLMALQNGHSSVALSNLTLPAMTYQQFRVTWATANYSDGSRQAAYVMPASGKGQVLSMPATTVFPGPVLVPSGGAATALLLLSGQQAVQSRADGSYTFQATGQALDGSGSATISGQALDGATPLAGLEVLAETVDGSGFATVQRRALTDATGAFKLEGLPIGNLYFVAAQGTGATLAYPAVAAAPVSALAATTYTANLTFSGPQAPGALAVGVSPASTGIQGTWVELRQALSTGGSGSQVLVVRSQTVATGSSQDQALFSGLAPGTYGVTVQRSTSGGSPLLKLGSQVLVGSGSTATASLVF